MGLEPTTFTLATCQHRTQVLNRQEVMNDPANACTAACTDSPDSGHDDALKHLAAALLALTPDQRAKVAAMLTLDKPKP